MCARCKSGTFFAHDADGTARDPTGTSDISARWEREAIKRMKALRRLVFEAVVENDVLGIEKPFLAGIFEWTFRPGRIGMGDAVAAPVRRAYEFRRSAGKVGAFMEWLRQAEADGILGVTYGTPVESAAERAWQNVYIESAYQKGLRDAESRGGSAVQAGFLRPIHADRVGLAYTRAFNSMKGVTDEMDKRIASVLARGIAEGRAPAWIARQIAKVIDAIGIVRARVIARTETIRAHAEASLNSYREAGIEGVSVKAEFSTARDNRVCPICAGWEGKVFTTEKAEGLIPRHPNCG